MNKIEKKSTFYEYSNLDQLSGDEQTLIQAAGESARKAYAPYSRFQVGAAVLLENGHIIHGNNQENAAYPSGLCAERIAVFYANAQFPDIPIVMLAITAIRDNEVVNLPIAPCGSCLQVLLETQRRFNRSMEILLSGKQQIIKAKNVEQFLPMNFNPVSLKGKKS